MEKITQHSRQSKEEGLNKRRRIQIPSICLWTFSPPTPSTLCYQCWKKQQSHALKGSSAAGGKSSNFSTRPLFVFSLCVARWLFCDCESAWSAGVDHGKRTPAAFNRLNSTKMSKVNFQVSTVLFKWNHSMNSQQQRNTLKSLKSTPLQPGNSWALSTRKWVEDIFA